MDLSNFNPRIHNGGGGGGEGGGGAGGQSGLKFFVPWPINECFGTTVLCLLRHLLTLIKWRHDC